MTQSILATLGLEASTVASRNPQKSNDHLRELHTRIIDAKAGFDVLVDKAEPNVICVATSFRDMHERHAAVIADILHGRGILDDCCTATLNMAVVSLRGWFDDIDDDVMALLRHAEAHVINAFRTAEPNVDPADKARLIGLRAEIEDLLDRMQHLG